MENLNDYVKYIQCSYKLLDECGILCQIRQQINKFSKKEKCREVKIIISLFSFYDSNVNLAKEFCENPIKLINIVEEVALSTEDVLTPTLKGATNHRFYINLSYTDVPPIEGMVLAGGSQTSSVNNRIVTFSGLIISINSGSKFSRSCSYRCADKLCQDRSNHFIDVFYPEFPTPLNSSRAANCSCGMEYEEDMSERVFQELREFSVILPPSCHGKRSKSINRAVSCIARGDVCKSIEIGKDLYFIGYLMTRGSVMNLTYVIEVCNVTVLPDLSASRVEHLSWMKIWHMMPADVSSYEFGPCFLMAFMFADEVSPAGSFFLLKLLLMLLLLSNTDEHQMEANGNRKYLTAEDLRYRAISLVVSAHDTNLVGRIISTASKYTKCFHWHGSQDLLLGRVSSDDKFLALEFGALLGPRSHIVHITNLLTLAARQVAQLTKVLQTRLVQPVVREGISICQQPLLCKVWAIMDSDGKSGSGIEGKLSNNLRSLIEASDLFYVAEEPNVPSWETTMSSSLLDDYVNASRSDCDEYHQLYNSFLQNASRIAITKWSREAELLLRIYYMIGRKATLETRSVFPQSALSVLLQLAISLAKLNNSSIIRPCDSLLAVFIYECINSSKYGLKLLNLSQECFDCISHVQFIKEPFLGQFQNMLYGIRVFLLDRMDTSLKPIFFEE